MKTASGPVKKQKGISHKGAQRQEKRSCVFQS